MHEEDLIELSKSEAVGSLVPVREKVGAGFNPQVAETHLGDDPVILNGKEFTAIAADEAELAEYFSGFVATTEKAQDKPRCGRAQKKCRCGYRYKKDDLLLLRCPDCKKDRRCWAVVKKVGNACVGHGSHRNNNKQIKVRAKSLTPTLRKRWREVVESIDFSSLLPEAALVEAHLLERLQNVDLGETTEVWKRLRKLVEKIDACGTTEEDLDRRQGLIEDVLDQIREGSSQSESTAEIIDLNQKVADLKKSQSVIEANRHACLSAPEAFRWAEILAEVTMEALGLLRRKWLMVEKHFTEKEFESVATELTERLLSDDRFASVDEEAVQGATEITMKSLYAWRKRLPVQGMSKAFIEARQSVADRLEAVAAPDEK